MVNQKYSNNISKLHFLPNCKLHTQAQAFASSSHGAVAVAVAATSDQPVRLKWITISGYNEQAYFICIYLVGCALASLFIQFAL